MRILLALHAAMLGSGLGKVTNQSGGKQTDRSAPSLFTEAVRSLKLGNVWIFVQLIFGPGWSKNQLYKSLPIYPAISPGMFKSYNQYNCISGIFFNSVSGLSNPSFRIGLFLNPNMMLVSTRWGYMWPGA